MSWFYWALGAAFFAGLTAILAKAGVGEVSPNLATAIRTSVALVFSWGLALATVPLATLGEISAKGWALLVFSGLATGLSWVCYFHALQMGPVSKVAPVDKLSVPVALVLAFLVFGERLTTRELLGAALIVAGAVVIASK